MREHPDLVSIEILDGKVVAIVATVYECDVFSGRHGSSARVVVAYEGQSICESRGEVIAIDLWPSATVGRKHNAGSIVQPVRLRVDGRMPGDAKQGSVALRIGQIEGINLGIAVS